jgi:hypothetical protein
MHIFTMFYVNLKKYTAILIYCNAVKLVYFKKYLIHILHNLGYYRIN